VVSSPEYISISPAPYKSKKYTSDFTTPNFRKALALNRPVDDWGKLLGDTAAVTALLDRLLHHAHVLKCGPRSWRTKVQTDLCRGGDEMKEVLQSRSKLPTRWPAQHAGHRVLENAGAFSTSFQPASFSGGATPKQLACRRPSEVEQRPSRPPPEIAAFACRLIAGFHPSTEVPAEAST
jgi:hypothetical protein